MHVPAPTAEESPGAAGAGHDRSRRSGQPRRHRASSGRDRQRSQALWVKLWAIEGITNIKKGGGTVPGRQREQGRQDDLAISSRSRRTCPGRSSSAASRRSAGCGRPACPRQMDQAHMANTAMLFLADADAKIEVRSEAARTLGLMQVSGACRSQLQAGGLRRRAARGRPGLANSTTSTPKSRRRWTTSSSRGSFCPYYVGPVYQSFEGIPGENNSGLLQMIPGGDAASRKYVQSVFDQVKPVAQESMGLHEHRRSKEYKDGSRSWPADRGPADVPRAESAGQPQR